MVRVNQFITLLLLITFIISDVTARSSAGGKLYVNADKTLISSGRPIRLEIYAVSLKSKITSIDLSPLNKDFGIESQYVVNNTRDERWPGHLVQALYLKLYPRKAGDILIPALYSGLIKSKPIQLKVKNGTPAFPVITYSKQQAFEREQFIISFTVNTRSASSRLEFENNIILKDFDMQPLPLQRHIDKDGRYRLVKSIALSARRSGNLFLQLPYLKYSESGVLRKKYYFPMQQLRIRPLPAYLPPTIPVGKITVDSKLPDNNYLVAGKLSYWKIHLSGSTINTYSLPSVIRQIKSTTNIRFSTINTERTSSMSNTGIVNAVTYQVPYKPLSVGLLDFPVLKIKYFDPETEKIISFKHKEGAVLVLNTLLEVIVFLLLVYAISWSIKHFYLRLSVNYQQYIARNKALLILAGKPCNDEFRQAISLLASAENWHMNITLLTWASLWKQKYQADYEFNNLVDKISSSIYGNTENAPPSDACAKLALMVKHKKKRRVTS